MKTGDYFIKGYFAWVSAALTESPATIPVLLNFFSEERGPSTENWFLIFGNTPEEEILNPSSRVVIKPHSELGFGALSSGGGCACHLSRAVLLWARFSLEKPNLGISWCWTSCQHAQDGHKSGELCAETQTSCKSLPRSWESLAWAHVPALLGLNHLGWDNISCLPKKAQERIVSWKFCLGHTQKFQRAKQ